MQTQQILCALQGLRLIRPMQPIHDDKTIVKISVARKDACAQAGYLKRGRGLGARLARRRRHPELIILDTRHPRESVFE